MSLVFVDWRPKMTKLKVPLDYERKSRFPEIISRQSFSRLGSQGSNLGLLLILPGSQMTKMAGFQYLQNLRLSILVYTVFPIFPESQAINGGLIWVHFQCIALFHYSCSCVDYSPGRWVPSNCFSEIVQGARFPGFQSWVTSNTTRSPADQNYG